MTRDGARSVEEFNACLHPLCYCVQLKGGHSWRHIRLTDHMLFCVMCVETVNDSVAVGLPPNIQTMFYISVECFYNSKDGSTSTCVACGLCILAYDKPSVLHMPKLLCG